MGMPSGGSSAEPPLSEGDGAGVSDALGLGTGVSLTAGWVSLGVGEEGALSLGLGEGVTLGETLSLGAGLGEELPLGAGLGVALPLGAVLGDSEALGVGEVLVDGAELEELEPEEPEPLFFTQLLYLVSSSTPLVQPRVPSEFTYMMSSSSLRRSST